MPRPPRNRADDAPFWSLHQKDSFESTSPTLPFVLLFPSLSSFQVIHGCLETMGSSVCTSVYHNTGPVKQFSPTPAVCNHTTFVPFFSKRSNYVSTRNIRFIQSITD